MALGAAVAGCSGSLVSPGDEPGNDAGTTGVIGPAHDASESPPVAAIIYPSTATTGDSVLALSNAGIDCSIRVAETKCSPTDANVMYWVGIELPPEDVTPGVYPLNSLIDPYFSAAGTNAGAPLSCWGGGGSFADGSLEILSVSSTAVVFRLQFTRTVDFDVNDTTFVAQVCPGA